MICNYVTTMNPLPPPLPGSGLASRQCPFIEKMGFRCALIIREGHGRHSSWQPCHESGGARRLTGSWADRSGVQIRAFTRRRIAGVDSHDGHAVIGWKLGGILSLEEGRHSDEGLEVGPGRWPSTWTSTGSESCRSFARAFDRFLEHFFVRALDRRWSAKRRKKNQKKKLLVRTRNKNWNYHDSTFASLQHQVQDDRRRNDANKWSIMFLKVVNFIDPCARGGGFFSGNAVRCSFSCACDRFFECFFVRELVCAGEKQEKRIRKRSKKQKQEEGRQIHLLWFHQTGITRSEWE